MRTAVFLVAVGLLASCSSTYTPPDRDAAGVSETEEELALVVSAALDMANCEVRFLGESDEVSFVWAHCPGSPGGISGPMRIDGDEVQMPGDGSRYSDDVNRMFPADMADVILNQPARVRAGAVTTSIDQPASDSEE